jgi:hypothetical protein
MTNREFGIKPCLTIDFDHRLRGIWILLLLAINPAAAARVDGPRASYKLNAPDIFTSPDHQTRVEQYSKQQQKLGAGYRDQPLVRRPG